MTTSDDAALQAFVGRTLQGRYRIDALLGSGGMGAVFRARHSGLGQDVAVKVLLPHVRGGEIATARFRREARSASRLDHPHCVRVLDFGELDDGTKFLVMQLVTGEELKRRLGAPWPALLAIDVAVQILGGLAHAHARGVVHRDLKPENVLLATDDAGQLEVKLVDFGIAKLLESEDGEPRLTRTGMRFGTPRYMSPEQAGGGKVDARTDLYAVGLLLYEMLAGRPPFQADEVAAIMRMHVLTPPPPLPDSVPAPLAAVVMRLLAKSRKQRYASAKDTLAALAAVRADLVARTVASTGAVTDSVTGAAIGPTTAVEGTWSASPRRPSSVRLPLLVAGGILILLWIAAAIVAVTRSPEPDAVPGPTVSTAPRAAAPKPAASPSVVAPEGPTSCRGDECECRGAAPCNLACEDDCELACKGSGDCDFACGDDCEVRCAGPGRCRMEVGDESEVKCTGPGGCDVTCRGACAVECRGQAACAVHCADDEAPGPRECRKALACGECP